MEASACPTTRLPSDEPGVTNPWHRWNLRFHPLGEPPPEALPGLIEAEIGASVAWLGSSGKRAWQLMGPQGRGKTAHLRALQAQWPQTPYVYLAEGEPVPPLPNGEALLLDEAQRLPRRRRRELGRYRRLALATHRDLTPTLARLGFEVRRNRVEIDRRALGQILQRRLEWARLDPGRPLAPFFDARELDTLWQRFGPDLRSLFDHLYEVWQLEARRPPGGSHGEM